VRPRGRAQLLAPTTGTRPASSSTRVRSRECDLPTTCRITHDRHDRMTLRLLQTQTPCFTVDFPPRSFFCLLPHISPPALFQRVEQRISIQRVVRPPGVSSSTLKLTHCFCMGINGCQGPLACACVLCVRHARLEVVGMGPPDGRDCGGCGFIWYCTRMLEGEEKGQYDPESSRKDHASIQSNRFTPKM
jgi:hypothetical protein